MLGEFSIVIVTVCIGIAICSFCFYMQKLQNKRNRSKKSLTKQTAISLKPCMTYSQYTSSIHRNRFHFTIAGTFYRHYNEKKIAWDLCKGDILLLEEEPNNIYDHDAIKVVSYEGHTQYGYVPMEDCIHVKCIISKYSDYDIEVTDVRRGKDSPFIDAVIKY